MGVVVVDGNALAMGVVVVDGNALAMGVVVVDGNTLAMGVVVVDGSTLAMGGLVVDGSTLAMGVVVVDGNALAMGVVVVDGNTLAITDGFDDYTIYGILRTKLNFRSSNPKYLQEQAKRPRNWYNCHIRPDIHFHSSHWMYHSMSIDCNSIQLHISHCRLDRIDCRLLLEHCSMVMLAEMRLLMPLV